MGKSTTLDQFFKQKTHINSKVGTSLLVSNDIVEPGIQRKKSTMIEVSHIDTSTLERDQELRQPIKNYLVNWQDEIRRAYIKVGWYQPMLSKYPKSGSENHL